MAKKDKAKNKASDPTVTVRVPPRLREFVSEWDTVKETKTYLDVQIPYVGVVELREDLRTRLKADAVPKAEVTAIKNVLSTLKEHTKKAKERTIDVRSLELAQHPVGAMVPPMSKGEMADLVKSIEDNGYLNEYPIIIHDGMILDGWHRYQACDKLGIPAVFKDYRGK